VNIIKEAAVLKWIYLINVALVRGGGGKNERNQCISPGEKVD